MNGTMKKTVKKIFVFPLFLIYFLIVEVWVGAGIYHVWDKMMKWTDK